MVQQAEQQQDWGKLFFLGVTALALSSFLPFSLFAPVPLAMAFLLYGRTKGLGLSLLFLAISFFLSVKFTIAPYIGGVYLLAFLYALVTYEIIFRKVSPVKGLMTGGFAILIVIVGLCTLIFSMSEVSLYSQTEQFVMTTIENFKAENKEILSAGGEQARLLNDAISKPKEIVDEIFNWAPSAIFVSVFVGMWVSLLMVLRNFPLWGFKLRYPFTQRELIHFKTPDYSIWILIAALSLFLSGDYLGKEMEIVGGNLLYCLGVFYFFQGFGILMSFLTYFKVFGFFRSMVVVFTIMSAWKAIVLVGMFDIWINFRKFLVKNIDKGDQQ